MYDVIVWCIGEYLGTSMRNQTPRRETNMGTQQLALGDLPVHRRNTAGKRGIAPATVSTFNAKNQSLMR